MHVCHRKGLGWPQSLRTIRRCVSTKTLCGPLQNYSLSLLDIGVGTDRTQTKSMWLRASTLNSSPTLPAPCLHSLKPATDSARHRLAVGPTPASARLGPPHTLPPLALARNTLGLHQPGSARFCPTPNSPRATPFRVHDPEPSLASPTVRPTLSLAELLLARASPGQQPVSALLQGLAKRRSTCVECPA